MLPLRINKYKNQSGQALLLVLLSMAVILTIVLSVSSKSVSDVSVGTYEEDALRAFSAAEAGVEKALLTNQAYPVPEAVNPSDSSVSFTSTITNNPEGSSFAAPTTYNAGDSATFWFVDRDPMTGSFSCSGGTNCFKGSKFKNICWGVNTYSAANQAEYPAVLVSLYYDDTLSYLSGNYNNVKIVRKAYDPNTTRASDNNFTPASTSTCTLDGDTFKFKISNINLVGTDFNLPCKVGGNTTTGCLIMARIKFFYNPLTKPEKVAIDMQGPVGLPAQGNKIESTGTAGNSTRKINVFQSFAEPPSIFDAAVFSESGFTK